MPEQRVRIRLTHKFAQMINGIDLSRVKEGEEIDVSLDQARMLVAEGWAAPLAGDATASAADKPPRRPHGPRTPKNPSR